MGAKEYSDHRNFLVDEDLIRMHRWWLDSDIESPLDHASLSQRYKPLTRIASLSPHHDRVASRDYRVLGSIVYDSPEIPFRVITVNKSNTFHWSTSKQGPLEIIGPSLHLRSHNSIDVNNELEGRVLSFTTKLRLVETCSSSRWYNLDKPLLLALAGINACLYQFSLDVKDSQKTPPTMLDQEPVYSELTRYLGLMTAFDSLLSLGGVPPLRHESFLSSMSYMHSNDALERFSSNDEEEAYEDGVDAIFCTLTKSHYKYDDSAKIMNVLFGSTPSELFDEISGYDDTAPDNIF